MSLYKFLILFASLLNIVKLKEMYKKTLLIFYKELLIYTKKNLSLNGSGNSDQKENNLSVPNFKKEDTIVIVYTGKSFDSSSNINTDNNINTNNIANNNEERKKENTIESKNKEKVNNNKINNKNNKVNLQISKILCNKERGKIYKN